MALDTYSKIFQAMPDILKSLGELYISGRGASADSSSTGTIDSDSQRILAALSGSVNGSSVVNSTGNEGIRSVTAVRPSSKPFIVGFIPPDVRLSFIPVDRTFVGTTTTGRTSLSESASASASTNVNTTIETPSTEGAGQTAVKLSDNFYRKVVEAANIAGMSPANLLLVLHMESGINPAAANYKKNFITDPTTGKTRIETNKEARERGANAQALGIYQCTPRAVKASGMPMEFWKNEFGKLSAEDQLIPYFTNYIKSVNQGPYETPLQAKLMTLAPSFVKKAGNPNTVIFPKYVKDKKTGQLKISNKWKQNTGDANSENGITVGQIAGKVAKKIQSEEYLSQLARMEAVVGPEVARANPKPKPGKETPVTNAATPSASTDAPPFSSDTGTGDNAETATISSAIMETGNIFSPEPVDSLSLVGRNITISDKRYEVVNNQVLELQNQIDAVNSIPALLMLVNPQEFTRNYEYQVDTPSARRGRVVQMWLERPLTISCKGMTAVQYAFGPSGDNSIGGGITHQTRLHSLSYVNLMSLVTMYRNNGHLYTQAVDGDSHNWGIPVISMSIFIYYDGHIYIGSFDDFSISDDAEKPYQLSYSFKFTVRYDFDVTQINDQAVSTATSSQFTATAFPRELSEAISVDQGVAVPSEEPGPTPTEFPRSGALDFDENDALLDQPSTGIANA